VKFLAGLKVRLNQEWTLTFPVFRLRLTDILVAGENANLLRLFGVLVNIVYTPGQCIDHISLVLDIGETFCSHAADKML
jgi:hypothetical protein